MLASIDKDKAKTNPSSVFDKPDDVVTHKELQPGEKATILREWELDARLMDVAIDEGMTKNGEGSETPNWQLGNPSNQDSTRNFEPLRQMTPRQSGAIASRRFAAFT